MSEGGAPVSELGVCAGLGRAERWIGLALSKHVLEGSPPRARHVAFSAAIT